MRFVAVALAAAVASPGLAPADDPGPRRNESTTASAQYTAEDIRATVEEHVERTTRESGGIYRLADDAHDGKTLDLELVRISIVAAGSLWRVHDPDRPVEGRVFFACTLFHLVGAPEGKVYDVDMRVERRDGELVVTDVSIHKEKQLVNGEWVWETRPQDPGGASTKGR